MIQHVDLAPRQPSWLHTYIHILYAILGCWKSSFWLTNASVMVAIFLELEPERPLDL